MEKNLLEHYHGDKVRALFVLGGLIMITSYPFFGTLIGAPLPIAIGGSILLAVAGGLMNPKIKWIMVLNTIIPVCAFLFFEYYAVYAYFNLSPAEKINIAFFWVNQVLAVIFFFAAYLSTKTLRGALMAGQSTNEVVE